MLDDSTERQIVRKSYELITAKNKWSEIESRLLATFIKELNPKSEDDFRELNISIDSIQKLWGTQVHTTHIRNLCVELKRKVYEIPEYKLKEDGTPNYEKIKAYDYVSLFSEIKYFTNEKYINFKFDDKMKPHLLDFSRFIKYRIENILQFKNRYSISFYELFKAQEFKKEKIKKIVLEIDYIHTWLDTPKSYRKLYANLKNKVLEPAMLDLQKYTDIYPKFKEIKTGRKVTHIEFSLTQNLNLEEKNKLFDDYELDNSYEKYEGVNCIYNGVYFENLKLITPYEEFYKVEFSNGNVIKFKNLKDLESIIVED